LAQEAAAPTYLEEVVVTATRYEEEVSGVPSLVTVIAAEKIAESPAQTVPELLQAAGLHVNDITGNNRTFTVDLRGFGEGAALNTLVLVDGRRINQADLSGTDWNLIPLPQIERIEIIRGGRGAVLYGDNASDGVINIITKKGTARVTGGEITVGSYEGTRQSAFLRNGMRQGAYSISAAHFKAEGYRENSQTEGGDIGGNFEYHLGERAGVELSGSYHEDNAGLPGALRKSELAAGAARTDSLNPFDFADVQDYYLKTKGEFFFSPDDLAKVDLSFRRRTFASFSSFSGGEFEADTSIETLAVSPQAIIKSQLGNAANSLTLGADFTHADEEIDNSSIFFGTASSNFFELDKKNAGCFIHDEISLLQRLSFSAGYRYDRAEFEYNTADNEAATKDEEAFNTGINYVFRPGSHVYVSFARSFRYPVLDELFNFAQNRIVAGLEPQISDHLEGGVALQLTSQLQGAINLFRLITEDEVFFDPIQYANKNMDGETQRKGVELSLAADFNFMRAQAAYTYTRAKIEEGNFDGNHIPDVPEDQVSMGLLVPFGGGVTAALTGVYVCERPFASDFKNEFDDQKEYFLVNSRLSYDLKPFELFLDLRNLLNEEYSAYGVLGSFPAEKAVYPSPEFNFLVGLRMSL